MDKEGSSTKHWAILVGINSYVNDRPLQGCVRDVEAIENFLRTGTGLDGIGCVVLSPDISADNDFRRSQEVSEQLSTYDNVKQSLARVLRCSQPGDLVYFHFSGHGTRNPHTGSLALVLLDQQHGTRYMYGQLLASMLERMVEKDYLSHLYWTVVFLGVSFALVIAT